MKKLKKYSKILLWVVALMTLTINSAVPISAAEDITMAPAAAILVEVNTSTVLFSQNEYVRRCPASLTKMMTAIVAFNAYREGRVALTDIVTLSDSIYFDVAMDGSTAGLKPGEQISFENLMYCMLLSSANEACNAVAEFISGDVATFVAEMNSTAAALGCTNTNFVNTHGMPNDNHYSCAYDLFLIAKSAMEEPLFAQIVGTESYTVPATNMSEERTIVNTNNLIRENSPYYYEYAKGIKTGYTDNAGFCLASYAQKEYLTLISIALGAESVILDDGTTQVQSFSESKKLLQWGFSNFSYRKLVDTKDPVCELPVSLGMGVNSVLLVPEKSMEALMDNEDDLSQVELKLSIPSRDNGEELFAPIPAGEILGEAEVFFNGVSYGKINLVANTTVELNRMKYISYEIGETLGNKYVKIAIFVLLVLGAAYIGFIVMYNINRRKKKQIAEELARKRIEEIRRGETLSSGKSFEEILDMQEKRDAHTKK